MILSHRRIWAAAAVVGLWATTARAASVYDFTVTATDGSTYATGQITTEDTTNALGGYNVTDINGTLEGNAIGGLYPDPNQPGTATDPSGNSYDNVLFPGTGELVDANGIEIEVPGAFLATPYRLYYDPEVDSGKVYDYALASQFGPALANLTVTAAVPEPGTAALAGVTTVAALLRRRRRR